MRRIVVLALCGVLAACVASCIRLNRQLAMHVWTRPLFSVVSPDGHWKAAVDETVYEPSWGEFSQDIVSLSLRSVHDLAHSTKMLALDYHGHPSELPRLSWVDADVLKVVLPNLSNVTIYQREFDGIHVDLHFDPDDPAARAAWLKQQ